MEIRSLRTEANDPRKDLESVLSMIKEEEISLPVDVCLKRVLS